MTPATQRERFQRALEQQPVDRPPVWFMRQAGRLLPEYRKIREEHSFLEVCHTPKLAREVTLQPVERFGMDAAIIFSDILVPFEGMGREVRYVSGKGPVLDDPVREPEDVDELVRPDPDEAYPALSEAVSAVREELPERGLVGFAGAPFTLACYMIEGGSPGRYEHVNRFRYEHPEAFERLLGLLADVVADQLTVQARAGADAVQLFDSHAEVLTSEDYAKAPLASMRTVLDEVSTEDVARIVFAKGSPHVLPELADVDAEALSVDWRLPLDEAAEIAPGKALQGNLEPATLLAPPKRAAHRARRVLEQAPETGHVFNLGHGVTPGARIDSVEAIVDAVQGAHA